MNIVSNHTGRKRICTEQQFEDIFKALDYRPMDKVVEKVVAVEEVAVKKSATKKKSKKSTPKNTFLDK